MNYVSQAWKDNQLEPFTSEGHIRLRYHVGDPDALLDASVWDSGHVYFSKVEQIINEAEKSYTKHLTLEKDFWALDGSFNYLPTNVTTEDVGYVSDLLSDENGEFTVHPTISLGFGSVHNKLIPGVTVVWGDAYDEEYAVDCVITAYHDADVVATRTFSGNTSTTTVLDTPISGYNKITVEILKWSKPFHRVRVQQLLVGLINILDKSVLTSYTHNSDIDLLSANLPQQYIEFEIDNVDGSWNPDNPNGVWKYLQNRQEITVKYGFTLNDKIEWTSGGTFYMSEWNTPQNGITAKFKASILTEYMTNKFNPSGLTSLTLYDLAVNALQQATLPTDMLGNPKWTLHSSLSNYTIAIPTDEEGNINFDYTISEVLQLIANASACVFWQDRYGYIHVDKPNFDYDNYDIDTNTAYENAEYQLSKQLKGVDINNGYFTKSTDVEAGEVQTLTNPLIQSLYQAEIVADWVIKVLGSRKTLSGSWRADPRVDPMDVVKVINKYATNEIMLTTIKLTFNGAFKGDYEGKVIQA